MADSFLSLVKAARLVGVPFQVVESWVRQGMLSTHPKPDGLGQVVRRADLEALLTAHHMPPLPPQGSPDLVDQFLAALPADLHAALKEEFPHVDVPEDPLAALLAEFQKEWPDESGKRAE